MKWNIFKGTRGQVSIINLFVFLIIVCITAILTPVANSIIQTSLASGNFSDTSILVANSVIPLWWVGIIITFFIYITPTGQNKLF